VGEDVQQELADIVIDPAARLDGGHDGGEVVVGQHHGGSFPGHVGAGAAHGDPDVGAAQRGRIVDAVAGHGDGVMLGPQGVGDAELDLRGGAGEDQLLAGAEQFVKVPFGHMVEFRAGDDRRVLAADARSAPPPG